ncbi:hypothetical protein ACA910_014620 [Epithemia clementina (nom. ined.)]
MSSFQRISSDPNDPTDDTAQESEDALSSGSASFRADENNHEDTTSINGFWKWVPGRLADVEDTTDNQQSASKYCIALVFGQCIAVLASSTNAASYSLSSRHNVNTQFFQLFLMYILLSTHLIWRKPNEGSFMQTNNIDATNTDDIATQHMLPFTNLRLKVPWWIYLIMSILDVFPNYLALFSYRYTSLTSATLLGSLAAPATMLFSKFILARVYKGHHFFGVALCIMGGSLTIWSDFDDESNSNSHSYIGDTLAIASALLYGFGDTAGEFFVKNIDRFEYLGMLGVFGTILTGMSFPFLEMGDIIGISKMSTKEESQVCGVMVCYKRVGRSLRCCCLSGLSSSPILLCLGVCGRGSFHIRTGFLSKKRLLYA